MKYYWHFVVGLLALAVCMVALVVEAHSHEWYPSDCCNNKDCRVLEPHEIKFTDKGFIIASHPIPFADVSKMRPSPDGRWHACFYLGEELKGEIRYTPTMPDGKNIMPCLWSPGGQF